jgi:hypothetical protein
MVTMSVRIGRRVAVFLGIALGRYWATGVSHNRWHSDLRLPFLQVGVVRSIPDRPRFRMTYMGWRGVDHRPRPAFREWTR